MKWNKVTWYSKLIALILFVVLPFVGFYLGIQYGENLVLGNRSVTIVSSSGQSGAGTGAAYYSNTAEWQTDMRSEADAGFTIAYPIDFTADDNYSAAPVTDWRLNASSTPGTKFLTITIPSAFDPQTNFADATLTVGASASNAAIANCLTPDPTGGPAATPASTTINGVPFTVFSSADAGAGNYYETTSYRTTHAGECWAVEYTIHSSQIGNYPPSYDLQVFDQSMIQGVLDRMVGTFKFQ
ncbi:MAG TPA: hypothetical protein VHZ04_02185 [Candidatus Paceibacterota bacterium]|jgi:hypothetical protein|nr:hypothetical protein [Candidatus Paceibacterota bacterium]